MQFIGFDIMFKECAEKFGISKLCKEQDKEYDLDSMMFALGRKVHDRLSANED